ncbi:HNH endonuclease [Rathayibacter sp. PhB127]|uniref:HNH endonuclease n=1 Tax=Rathayibacter sp. PhB127 TaxID=2485176 RepID=UPI0037C767A1
MRERVAKAKPDCHICGRPILWDAPHTDPLSFVIDHVRPLHLGGEDALSNVRAAHRCSSCNSTKRARLVAPIVRRSRSLE